MALKFEYSVTAKCKPEHAWEKFSKIEEWPWWNRVIGQARWLQGQPWQKGSQFYMELVHPRKMTFKPVIIESAPPLKIAWLGKASGFSGEHWFTFEPQPDGSTLLTTWENMSGWKTALLTRVLKRSLHTIYQEWLDALKSEAEKIAREQFARS
jgi:hypothetical protein